MNDLEERLKEIEIEDYIWVIYIGIIILSFYSNYLEKKYFINHDEKSKDLYKKITIFIFAILLIVYIYFFKDSFDSIKSLKKDTDDIIKDLTYLSFIASAFILIAGIIYLYVAIKNENIDIELAFN